MKRFLILLVLFPVAFATSYPAFTLEELYTRANVVLYGTVDNVEHNRNNTELTLRDHEVLLGDETIDTLTWFGTTDIAGLDIPEAGTNILAFAYTDTTGLSPIVGFARGLFTETNGRYANASGTYIALSGDGELSLTTEAHDGADASSVREALAAPTFAETLDAEAPEEATASPAPEDDRDVRPGADVRTISITVSESIQAEATFTRALAAWNEALQGHARIEAVTSEDATINVGDATELGDAVSVTYRDASRLISEINVRGSSALVFNAFLVEIGVHAGAQPGTSPAVTSALPTSERALTPADADAVLSRVAELPGDINRDGVVDFLDLVLLASQHGQRGINLPGDINNDGVVDDADVAILKEHYLFTAPEKP